MRSRLGILAIALIAPFFTGFDCGSSPPQTRTAAPASWTSASGAVTVDVQPEPVKITLRDKAGDVLLESADLPLPADANDPMRAYAPLAMTHDTDTSVRGVMMGWNYYRGVDGPWTHATRAVGIESSADALVVHLETDDAAHATATLTVTSAGDGARIVLAPDANDPDAGSDASVNRVSLAFKMHDDDHFFGFGERFVRSDHRGQLLYTWVEDGGFGQGENTPPGPANPFPNGEGQTNMPIPWFLSPRGFGALLNTTYRSVYHLGDDAPGAFRVEAWTGKLDMTVFADPDPLRLVEDLTAITGRPPDVADWAFAPRRRANIGSPEMDALRQNHVPTSVIDTALHYFPNGVGADLSKPGALKAVTDDIHRRGFKAIAYFCPFVADSFHPVFDEAAQKGFLVKKPDGTPYTVLDPPYNAAMVDFTNPDAVTWYQSHLQQAIDDGWDGWMYDFAEYVPQDAVFFNGMTGMEAHNLYPVLYQKAAFDLLERVKKKDYLIFVRSGYAGTGGSVPMVWAGDQNTDFDLADGLPAALQGALNVGMSGVPLWGSDISGYHFIYNPPPDKELYIRWTELGAFSADMHDENEGAGNGTSADRWQIWKDQETLDAYKKYASYKTRMLPYVKVAVRQARERGTPVMRHLYLSYPRDPNVYAMGDEYMYGDGLLVAPVVARGVTSRKVYLPDAAYFDFWTGARVGGGRAIDAPAPLDAVPVFARVGAIVPMLAPDVETVVPAADGSAVSAQDRAGQYEVQVFAGGQTSVALDDGTTIAQSAPTGPFDVGGAIVGPQGPIPSAASAADLASCDACAWTDTAAHTVSIVVKTQSGAIDAGALHLSVGSSPDVKRFVFVVHH